MQDFIAGEKARLQELFAAFNETGSWMELREPGCQPLRIGLIDSYQITRVAPHFDTQGNVVKTDFWLFFKSAGYSNGFQYVHTTKVVDWSQEDTYLLDLTDDLGRRFHIELLFSTLDIAMVADWRDWQAYKRQNQERFQQIDAELLEEHVRIAEDWQ